MIRQRKTDYMFYRLVDTFVDNYFIVAEHLADRLELLEEENLQDPNENINEEIYELKKKIGLLKE
jgi:magnesium transporter